MKKLLDGKENPHLPGNRSILEQTGKMSLPKNILLKCWIELSTEKPEFIPQTFPSSKLELFIG